MSSSTENSEPFVKASGGVMLQMLPGANGHIITMIEDTINHAPHITSVISKDAEAKDLVKLALGEIDFEILEVKEVKFECNCSFERAVTLISSLGRDEVASMLTEDKGAKMTCGFCNELYTLDEANLQEMLDLETN